MLRKGALHVRTRTVPETTEVAFSVEMREVLDLATEKALRNFVGIAARAGGRLTTVPRAKPAPSDEECNEDQRGRVWNEERVGFAELDEIMNAAVVRLRGWPVPFVDYPE
jgi:hypothetical protein